MLKGGCQCVREEVNLRVKPFVYHKMGKFKTKVFLIHQGFDTYYYNKYAFLFSIHLPFIRAGPNGESEIHLKLWLP